MAHTQILTKLETKELRLPRRFDKGIGFFYVSPVLESHEKRMEEINEELGKVLKAQWGCGVGAGCCLCC